MKLAHDVSLPPEEEIHKYRREQRVEQRSRPPVRPGQIVSWDKQRGGQGPRRIAQVVAADEELTELKDTEGNSKLMFGTASLRSRIERGEIKIEEPVELLDMIAQQVKREGNLALAHALEQLISRYAAYT